MKYKLLNEWYDYVRLNCGNFQTDNRYQYMMLRKIALLYYRKTGGRKPLSVIITEIAEELKITKESVEDNIIAVSTFKPKYNADFYGDDEDDGYSTAVNSVSDGCSAETEFFGIRQRERLLTAIGKLSKTERMLLENKFGICANCLGNIPKATLRSTSMMLDLTESGAEKKIKNILNKLNKSLQD